MSQPNDPTGADRDDVVPSPALDASIPDPAVESFGAASRATDGGPAALASHMAAFGNQLHGANAAHAQTRGRGNKRGRGSELGGPAKASTPRRSRKVVLSGATLATGLAVTAALVAMPTGTRLDAIAEAQAALEQPGMIVHYRVFSQSSGPGQAGSQEREYCAGDPAEIWRTTSGPLRWRLRMPETRCGVTTGANGRAYVGDQELSYADGVRTNYSPGGRPWLQQETGVPTRSAEVPHYASTLIEKTAGADPVAAVRRLLESGELKDIGETEARGRKVRRLVGDGPPLPEGSMAPSELKDMDITYDVDPTTFVPVTIELVLPKPHLLPGDDPERLKQWMADRNTITLEFSGYEQLPLAPENERLLAAPVAPETETLPATSWNEAVRGRLPHQLRPDPQDAAEFTRVVRERNERQQAARRADEAAPTTP